jgi:N-acetylmuramic acid 6-phosphate etherase
MVIPSSRFAGNAQGAQLPEASQEKNALVPPVTEQANPATANLEALDTLALLQVFNEQDKQVPFAVERALPQLVPVVEVVSHAFLNGGRLFYLGAGTSGRLGVLDASEMPPTYGVPAHWVQAFIAGGDVALRHPVEGAEDDPLAGVEQLKTATVGSNDVVVGLSASGGAPYVLGAMAYAKQVGAVTVGVACVPGSALLQAVAYPVCVETGPESITGSTRLKAGTAQKLVLNLITTASMVKVGKTYGHFMVDVKATNSKLKQRASRLVQTLGLVEASVAEALLQASEGQVKPAILMAKQGLSYPQALQALQQANGFLSAALMKVHS